MKRIAIAASLLLAPVTAVPAQERQQPPAPSTTFLRCGSLVDGKRDEVRRDVVIRIVGEGQPTVELEMTGLAVRYDGRLARQVAELLGPGSISEG